MSEPEYEYNEDQMAAIFAKLEVSKLLISMGTEIAKQVQTDVKFYRITNDSSK